MEELKLYQKQIINIIQQEPDHRIIYWYYDPTNTAKVNFSYYLKDNYDAQLFIANIKDNDVAYKWDSKKIAVFNLMKTNNNHIYPYRAMHALKDGHIISPKWRSCTKIFPRAHVIVFSNHLPLQDMWSKDVYHVQLIKQDNTLSDCYSYDLLPTK